jgi:hypothetical protein
MTFASCSPSLSRFSALVLTAVSVTACQQTTASVAPQASVNSSASPLTCTKSIADFDAVIRNDRATGHIHDGVYTKVRARLSEANTVCASGNPAEADRRVAQTKSDFGYR